MDQAADLTITAPWTPRFQRAVDKLLKTEGGYVDHPADPGGATNHGISLRFLKAEGKVDIDGDGRMDFDLDMDGDIDAADIRKLTRADAAKLYHRCFWQRWRCENMASPIGEMVFDQAVNGGGASATKMLQRSINSLLPSHVTKLDVDGLLGPTTLNMLGVVLTLVTTEQLATTYREIARARYRALVNANPKLNAFLRGWLNRADDLGRL